MALTREVPTIVEAPIESPPTREERTRLVLLVRDPWWLYAYWEISPGDRERNRIGLPHGAPPLLLRVYDMGEGEEPSKTENYFDVTVITDVSGWYVNVPRGGGHWRTALGYLDSMANFVTLCQSNIVTAPSEGTVEWNEEELWGSEEELAAGLNISGTLLEGSRASEVIHRVNPPGRTDGQQVLRPGASEQILRPGASEYAPGSGLMEQPTRAEEVNDCLRLQVYTELILYGATDPTAQVSVQGNPVRLRPDGTFTLRFALPDGEQNLPIRAVSEDRSEERVITPTVKKWNQ